MHFKTVSLTALLLLLFAGPGITSPPCPDSNKGCTQQKSCGEHPRSLPDLSPETRKELDRLVAEYATENESLRRELMESMAAVNNILTTAKPDEQALNPAVDKVVEIQGRMTRNRYALRLDITRLTGFSHPPLSPRSRAGCSECGAKKSPCPKAEVP